MKKVIIIVLVFFTGVFYAQDKTNLLDDKGLRHGVWKGVFEQSKRPRYEGVFNHGEETGVFKYFDDTKAGTVIATRDFTKGKGNCYVTIFDQKGNKVSEGNLINKLHEGQWKFYHMESNNIMTLENYKADKLHGVKKVFYRSNTLAEETNYVNGLKNGISRTFSEKEVIIDFHTYKEDKLDGLATYYDGNGQKLYEGNYSKGLKIGTWKFFEKSKLIKEVKAKFFSKELAKFENKRLKKLEKELAQPKKETINKKSK